jgi:hypothetical protein
MNTSQKGQSMIERIEKYKRTNGNIPEVTEQFDPYNAELGQGPYYKKMSKEEYIVFFNIGFDDQLIYNSKIKEWKEKP